MMKRLFTAAFFSLLLASFEPVFADIAFVQIRADDNFSTSSSARGTAWVTSNPVTGNCYVASMFWKGAVTLTWTSGFADANYMVNCSVIEADADALTLKINHIESVPSTAVVVWV